MIGEFLQKNFPELTADEMEKLDFDMPFITSIQEGKEPENWSIGPVYYRTRAKALGYKIGAAKRARDEAFKKALARLFSPQMIVGTLFALPFLPIHFLQALFHKTLFREFYSVRLAALFLKSFLKRGKATNAKGGKNRQVAALETRFATLGSVTEECRQLVEKTERSPRFRMGRILLRGLLIPGEQSLRLAQGPVAPPENVLQAGDQYLESTEVKRAIDLRKHPVAGWNSLGSPAVRCETAMDVNRIVRPRTSMLRFIRSSKHTCGDMPIFPFESLA